MHDTTIISKIRSLVEEHDNGFNVIFVTNEPVDTEQIYQSTLEIIKTKGYMFSRGSIQSGPNYLQLEMSYGLPYWNYLSSLFSCLAPLNKY